jgi:hypothetical protein
MAHPVHHALSSSKKFSTEGRFVSWEEHYPIHSFLDSSKSYFSDARHRALFHQEEGFKIIRALFKNLFSERDIEIIVKQHIEEDLGRVPALNDWIREEEVKLDLKIKDVNKKTREEVLEELCDPWGDKRSNNKTDDLKKCIDFLLPEEKIRKTPLGEKQMFFYFTSIGPFLCENYFGPIINKNDDGKEVFATRTAVEGVIKKVWGMIPSFQDYMQNRGLSPWMWENAKNLSKELSNGSQTI